MISLHEVSKTYANGAVRAVRNVSFEVAAGELVVLLGESGCGKTTTLKMINRLVERSAGIIRVAGEDVARIRGHHLRRRIGYVFQGIGLFPHMTVAENVAVVPRLLGWSHDAVDVRIAEVLALVGLDPSAYAKRRPGELSGGQQQRVGVARALAARPSMMLMDEPFGALDPITRLQVQDELRALQRRLELTIVLVTHDMTEALLMADRILVMKDGRIIGSGTPSQLLSGGGHPYVEKLMAMPRRQADRVERLAGGEA